MIPIKELRRHFVGKRIVSQIKGKSEVRGVVDNVDYCHSEEGGYYLHYKIGSGTSEYDTFGHDVIRELIKKRVCRCQRPIDVEGYLDGKNGYDSPPMETAIMTLEE